eukprot:COSAG06_NODE_52952_length_302_cov_20.004926_1_plen_70_part_01
MDVGDGDTTQTRRVMEAAEMRRCSRAATIHTRRSLTRADGGLGTGEVHRESPAEERASGRGAVLVCVHAR